MKEALAMILEEGVVPVIRVASAEEALEVAKALKEGGISVIEVTMTVPGAMDVIKEVSQKFKGKVLLGAGTILDAETARLALINGAQFLVTPTLNVEVIKMSNRYSAVVIPGALTPTEILTAWEAGADLVKVFPIGQVGGPAYIRAIKAPLPHIPLVPTGGVNLQNAGEFIKAGAAAIAAGGELVDKKAVAEKKYSVVIENARKFLAEVKKARGK
ncbi:MAG: bifunctional 4-hydroxy-2-oxoglutarate aldolase/2-dehydro-3-deoxy-phosphogluconate aldolase [Deltaproteobacteria bacterium]|nr:bifunctional 4-hydroxy-2-oxoglutarate aldolase/2-dehydro-3-deoxy-phosphogluconate aldolase [Deltaproteobacteria bacterium]